MIPGLDGTGRSPDGSAVYFGGVRSPHGPMAQRAAAGFVLPLPDGLDAVTAAAIPVGEIISAIPEFMSIAVTGDLPIDIDEVPLAEVESAWRRGGGGRRIVLRP